LAAIHVAGPVVVGQASGHAVGRGMSYFMAGGALARTAGPLVAVHLVSTFGLEGMWRVVPVAVASSVVLWWRLRRLPERPPARRPSGLFAVWKAMQRTLWAVLGILVTRALMVGALASFLPTFLYREGESLLRANVALALFELSAAAGAMTLGTVSDRVGRRPVLFFALTTSPLLMLAFLFASGPTRLAALAALGFLAPSTAPVLMAIMIEHAGGNAAAANGTYMMISFVARSAVVLAVGALGDGIGLRAAYLWCAGLAVLALPFVFLLPRDRRSGAEVGRPPA
jgi:FSR family fosmidomycin resistance protein-like MFS transporter